MTDLTITEDRQTSRRPAFLALCEFAIRDEWCWSLGCTTCGHMYFRFGLLQIIRGDHPDDSTWNVRRTVHDSDLLASFGNAFHWRGSREEQEELIRLVSETRLADLEAVVSFPDWLGHLGLALWHTEEVERETFGLTEHLAPQFLKRLPARSRAAVRLRWILEKRKQPLRWQHLELVEHGMLEGGGYQLAM